MKRTLILVLALLVPLSLFADNSKISPDLQNSTYTGQTQVVVQYAPGTQLSCSGILGLLGCVVNDVLKLGGAVLGQLPIVNGLVHRWTTTGSCLSQISPTLFTSVKTGRSRHFLITQRRR